MGEFVTRRFVIAIAAVFALGLTACGGGGSESQTDVVVEATTKGQRLTDLKGALDSGAITKEEHEEERKKILDQ